MKENDLNKAIGKFVNFLTVVALGAGAVNEFAVKAVEHIPTWAPFVIGALGAVTSPALSLGGLLSIFKKPRK
jgi:hypothetical protein